MDFIERIFHISPDGGTGTLELTFLIMFLIAPIAAVMFVRRRRARSLQLPRKRERDV